MELVVALDVGGTDMKGGLMNPAGELVHETRFDFERTAGPVAIVERILDAIGILVDEASDKPRAIGLAVPGLVDEESGVALRAANLGWTRVPFVEMLTEQHGVPVALGHDVRSAAYAEYREGAARGVGSFIFLYLSAGIGGAFMLDGKTMLGTTGRAMEIGHLRVRPDGARCRCGGRGCLESIASASSIEANYAALVGTDSASVAEIVQLVEASDPTAARVWQEAVDGLADALMSTITLLDPELIVFGGTLSEVGPQLLDPLTSAVSQRLALERLPVLRMATFADLAGCVGAGFLAWDRLAASTAAAPDGTR